MGAMNTFMSSTWCSRSSLLMSIITCIVSHSSILPRYQLKSSNMAGCDTFHCHRWGRGGKGGALGDCQGASRQLACLMAPMLAIIPVWPNWARRFISASSRCGWLDISCRTQQVTREPAAQVAWKMVCTVIRYPQ